MILAALLAVTLCHGAVVPTYTPPAGGPLNISDFSDWLLLQAPQSAILRVAAGVYAVPAPTANMRAHLPFPPLQNVTLDCSGVTFVAAARAGAGLYLPSWVNATLLGLTLRYAEPPSNTAYVVAINGSTLDVVVAAGHPLEDWVAGTVQSCNVFEPVSLLQRAFTWDLSVAHLVQLTATSFRATFSSEGQLVGVQAGDLLGCRVPNGGMTLTLDGGANCTLQDVALYGGPCFGYFEAGGGGGNTYRNVSIRYPDAPTGAIVRPMLSTSADGLHSVGARVGPLIDGAHFEGMNDDGIAIHGYFALVTDALYSGGTATARVWLAGSASSWQAGDSIALYDPTFAPAPLPVGPAFASTLFTVLDAVPAPANYTAPSNASRTMPSQPLPAPAYTILTVAMASWITNLGFDWVSVNTDTVGGGYVIRNTIIQNHRARGLLLKGTHGLVENVVITNSSLGGIIVTPELYWREAGYARDVVIRNVSVTLTSTGRQSYGGIALGAVAPSGLLAAAPGHANVLIEDNVLVDCAYAPLWLNAAGNVTVRRNTIIAPFSTAPADDLPACCMPLPAARIAVYAQSVQGLVMSGNCVAPAAAGSALEYLFNATADCTGDFAGGVTQC